MTVAKERYIPACGTARSFHLLLNLHCYPWKLRELVQNTPDNGSDLSGTFLGASVKPCLQHKPVIPYCMVHYKFCKDNKNQQIPISRVNITRPCCFSPLWGTQEPRTGSCVFIVHGLPRIRTLEIPLTSGFATGFATPGRMYIPAFSIWTYSDVGLKCIRS